MNYHNLVKAGFAVCCALMLQFSISIFSDALLAPNKAKAAGYAIQGAAHATVASATHK
ncbi:hypothetical protein M2323_001915 [Rhodoblastus acidophilus]|nr:hypothetical protein [Rhodoblastus acidophilus]MCW2332993.1 hypothetical protein [Rhodoblastus acidophilus]